MISFPICEKLRITGYGLYPGQSGDHDLDIDFQPGLTLILGANGLGKTTLITLLFRMLTGPADLRLRGGEAMGTASLDAIDINSEKRREFAQRVRDGAENAKASLTFKLGSSCITVTRALRNLQIEEVSVDGEVLQATEELYQSIICEKAGVYAFGDFLLLLRQLVFFFEDRRSLVWDTTAQRQILRTLFLVPEEAKEWSHLERIALRLDSELRNIQAVMTREERRTDQTIRKQQNISEVRIQLEATEQLRRTDLLRQEFLGTRAAELDSILTVYRLNKLRAEQTADSAKRNVERAQLSVIEKSFPSVDESLRYIFAQLVSDGVCRACGQESHSAVERMHRNISEKLCAICDHPLPEGNLVSAAELSATRIESAKIESSNAQQHLASVNKTYRETLTEYSNVQNELAELSNRIDQQHQKIRALTQQLPPEEASVRESQNSVEALRVRVESLRSQLAVAQENFSEFVTIRTRRLHNIAEQLKSTFSNYAEGFLLEKISLTWSPIQQKVGQFRDNPFIEFPAFGLDITGSDFPEPVRRDGPEQVSESQREFIDLAFRMALIEVSTHNNSGTLVIDAPESSLDAVFVRRAADVLGRFAKATQSNRLIVTSNILSGDLLPELIRASSDSEHNAGIIDLFELGVPTAAIKALHSEYALYRQNLFEQIEMRKVRGETNQ
ncbi:AAA family ATPase [Ectopseudomonas hydrolytica]|uniref:AAA family ATPase n=1 Tax=Ectopseudomonas hydrolytica TaxID=2493633 RepID=UPI003C30D0AC